MSLGNDEGSPDVIDDSDGMLLGVEEGFGDWDGRTEGVDEGASLGPSDGDVEGVSLDCVLVSGISGVGGVRVGTDEGESERHPKFVQSAALVAQHQVRVLSIPEPLSSRQQTCPTAQVTFRCSQCSGSAGPGLQALDLSTSLQVKLGGSIGPPCTQHALVDGSLPGDGAHWAAGAGNGAMPLSHVWVVGAKLGMTLTLGALLGSPDGIDDSDGVSLGVDEGASLGPSDGDAVGVTGGAVGVTGSTDGDDEGALLGPSDGDAVGVTGGAVGVTGSTDGDAEDVSLGPSDGDTEGLNDGVDEGVSLGLSDGDNEGVSLGSNDGVGVAAA